MSGSQQDNSDYEWADIENQIDFDDPGDDIELGSDDDDEYEQNHVELDFKDYSEVFKTKEIFNTKDDVVNWIRGVGRAYNMVLVITRSLKSLPSRRGKCWLQCDRHGTNISTAGKHAAVKPRKASSKKDSCPFRIKCHEVTPNAWVVKVVCCEHNHQLPLYREGNAFERRLTTEEYELVKDLTASHMKPKNILDTIKKHNPSGASTIKTIHNARQKAKREGLQGRTIVQQFMRQVDCYNYFERHRIIELGVVSELFFAHPESLNLLRSFPYVLIMDSTYKTNKYGMPFLEIVGFTSTWKTFPIAGVFMRREKEENYTYVMKWLKEMLRVVQKMPNVIVSDREQALLNALKIEFPHVRHLLCRRHIYKDIEARCLKEKRNKKEANQFEFRCKGLFQSKTKEEYNNRLANLEMEWKARPTIIQYLKDTWLNPYKDRFVSVWTDNITHFGTHTSNRVESAHSSIKKFLGSNRGGFDTVFSHVHSNMELLIIELKASFEFPRSHVRNDVSNVTCFRLLQRMISYHAFDILMKEHRRLRTGTLGTCDCKLPTTHGLPCCHQISTYVTERRLIKPGMIHRMWKTLQIEVPNQQEDEIVVLRRQQSLTLEEFYKAFPQWSDEARMKAYDFMYEMLHPESVIMEEPPPVKTRGRPKKSSTKRDPSSFEYARSSCVPGFGIGRPPKRSKCSPSGTGRSRSTSLKAAASSPSKYPNDIPSFITSFIQGYVDVVGDGHCGFRSVAESLTFGQRAWKRVREELIQEAYKNINLYEAVVHSGDVGRIISKMDYYKVPANISHWFSLPDMGHIVATCYQCVFAVIGSATYLPLIASTTTKLEHIPIISATFLRSQNHFVSIQLSPGSPLPPLNLFWARNHHISVDGLEGRFSSNFAAYEHGLRSSLDV